MRLLGALFVGCISLAACGGGEESSAGLASKTQDDAGVAQVADEPAVSPAAAAPEVAEPAESANAEAPATAQPLGWDLPVFKLCYGTYYTYLGCEVAGPPATTIDLTNVQPLGTGVLDLMGHWADLEQWIRPFMHALGTRNFAGTADLLACTTGTITSTYLDGDNDGEISGADELSLIVNECEQRGVTRSGVIRLRGFAAEADLDAIPPYSTSNVSVEELQVENYTRSPGQSGQRLDANGHYRTKTLNAEQSGVLSAGTISLTENGRVVKLERANLTQGSNWWYDYPLGNPSYKFLRRFHWGPSLAAPTR